MGCGPRRPLERAPSSPWYRRTARADGLETGWYVRPTLFSDATNDMRIAREEIFGPVLTVISYRDEDEAIRIAKTPNTGWRDRCSPPTSSAVTTWRPGCGRAPSTSTRATSWIRRHRSAGSSGYGRELGTEGIDSYTVSQSISAAM